VTGNETSYRVTGPVALNSGGRRISDEGAQSGVDGNPISGRKTPDGAGYSCSSENQAGRLSGEGVASKSLAGGLNHVDF
jgi:hypothetical protein